MPVRLVDVARRAGVSPSTVSYVLSGNRPISAETRRRVEESIAELGFRPHAGARSIRRQSTKDRKSTRLNSSHNQRSRMPSSA